MKKGELLGKVIVFATNAHAGQSDKGGMPYIMHPLAVMHILNSSDEELNCIALLHDTVEDCDVAWDDLKDIGCTDRIIEGIKCLTKMPGESYDQYKIRVFSNADAMCVKMADLTHNTDIRRLKGVREKDVKRMVKYHMFYLELQQELELIS